MLKRITVLVGSAALSFGVFVVPMAVAANNEVAKCSAETQAVENAKVERDMALSAYEPTNPKYNEVKAQYDKKVADAEKSLEDCKNAHLKPPALDDKGNPIEQPNDPKGCEKATAEYDQALGSGVDPDSNDAKKLKAAKDKACGVKPHRSDNNYGNTDDSAWEAAAKKYAEEQAAAKAKEEARKKALKECSKKAEEAIKANPTGDVDYYTVWEKCLKDAGYFDAAKDSAKKGTPLTQPALPVANYKAKVEKPVVTPATPKDTVSVKKLSANTNSGELPNTGSATAALSLLSALFAATGGAFIGIRRFNS